MFLNFSNYLIRAFFSVNSSMNLQIFLDAKHFVAELALERPFTSVSSIMTYLNNRKKDYLKSSRQRQKYYCSFVTVMQAYNV
jgi:hypothetical protein